MALLQIDGAVVIAGNDVLHVVTRRGAFDLSGKGIHRLHARLHPFLWGEHDEAALLEAVGEPHAGAVRSYLAGLRDAGALRTPEPDPPLGELGAERSRLAFTHAGCRFRISLAGPLPAAVPSGGVHLCFATEAEAGRLLLELRDDARRTGRFTCVVAPAGVAVAERANYGRFLLRNEINAPGPEGRARFFALDVSAATLIRLASIEPGAGLATLPDQLRIVRYAEVDQLPLVIAEGSPPFSARRLYACGLEFGAVRDGLLRAVVADNAPRGGWRAGWIDAPLHAFVPVSPPPDGSDSVVAASLLEVRAGLVEQWANRCADVSAMRETDLLREPGDHPALAYLRDVLRLRRSELSGQVGRTPHGVRLYAIGEHRAASLQREKALAEVLLRAALTEFYPELAHAPISTFRHRDFGGEGALRRRVRASVAAMRGEAPHLRVAVRRVRGLGVDAWVGELRDAQG